jgi:hypothetical protein
MAITTAIKAISTTRGIDADIAQLFGDGVGIGLEANIPRAWSIDQVGRRSRRCYQGLPVLGKGWRGALIDRGLVDSGQGRA